MATTVKFSCNIKNTNPQAELGLEIWLDDVCLYNIKQVPTDTNFSHEFPDSEGEHELKFVMKGKTTQHTTIDSLGNIVSDSTLMIKNIEFDEIDCEHIVNNKAVYTHDYNGTQPLSQHKFYQELGCNGVVSLKFTTPLYLWLLENV